MTDFARPVREVIDVDLIDDEELSAANAQSRRQRRRLSPGFTHTNRLAGPSSARDPIIILDSDDETGRSPQTSRRRRRALRSPPLAPRGISPIPPVPPLRTHRHSHHRNARAHRNPPAIVPNDLPYAFEADLGQPSRRNRSPPLPAIPPPRASARSHHQPSMGLGGAILSLARREAQEDQHRRQQPQPSTSSRLLGGIADFISGTFGYGPARNFLDEIRLNSIPRAATGRTDWQEWPFAQPNPAPMDFYNIAPPPKSTEPMWKPSYTHPTKIQPGFACDFVPQEKKPEVFSGSGTSGLDAIIIQDDDDEGLTSIGIDATQAKPTSCLVCARCVEPLVLNSGDASGITEEEKKNLRVWGLRCGHMLDGRCIHSIMRPPVPSLGDKRKADDDLLPDGPGKRRITRNSNGKGKAVAVDNLWEDYPGASTDTVALETSIRSRLRSRLSRSDVHDMADYRPQNSSPRLDTASKRGKGKGRARKPVVLEQFEWMCPVSGCGRMHRSVRMSDTDESVLGGWSMDSDQGAIALFV